jgi:DNA-binding NarL/FixJ family response regulator
VVLADDHAVLRRAMADWLTRSGDFEVVAEVGSGEAAMEAAATHQPALAVLDIDMPGRTAFECAVEIRRASPRTRIVFLSGFWHDRYIAEAIAVRAAGYVVKSEAPGSVLEALTKVVQGGTYFSPEVRDRLIIDEQGVRLGESAVRADVLSGREREVLRHVARGMSKREIATILHLSPRTVERHVANIMEKLGIHDRVELARFAIRERYVEP